MLASLLRAGKSSRTATAASTSPVRTPGRCGFGPGATDGAPARGSVGCSALRGVELRSDGVPVDDVPPRGKVVRTPVLVVEVVRVLPDVDPEDRRLPLHHRGVLVRGRDDREPGPVP